MDGVTPEMTTEQALRRLRILGLTKDDEPIARALAYMEHNLLQPHPTVFHEKKHDSKTYGVTEVKYVPPVWTEECDKQQTPKNIEKTRLSHGPSHLSVKSYIL